MSISADLRQESLPAPGPGARPSRLYRAVCAGLPLVLYVLQVCLYLPYLNDDAFITFRYSRFLAMGRGPYFNLGEHVEGYTNFLYMLLLAPVYAIGGEAAVPVAAKAVGILAHGVALIVLYRLCVRLCEAEPSLARYGPLAGGLGAGLVAAFPGYAVNAVSGLETALFTLAILLGVYLAAGAGRGRGGAGLAWAAAALTRPEGGALFAVHWILRAAANGPQILAFLRRWRAGETASRADDAGRREVRVLILDGAIVTGAIAAQLVFRMLLYDGALLPNTFYAKAAGFLGRTHWDYIRRGALRPFFGPLGVLAGLAGWLAAPRAARRALPVIGLALCGALLPFVVGGDWMPGWRFSVPFLPLLAAVVSLGWLRLLFRVETRVLGGRRLRWAAPVVALALVGGAVVYHFEERLDLLYQVTLRAWGYRTGHLRLVSWLHESTSPGDVIALMDVGMVGYYCPDRTILDITGLTDRVIAKSPGPLLAKMYDPMYVFDRKPKVIVLVLAAPGDPRQPVPDVPQVRTWTGIGARFWKHPEFEKHYRHRRRAGPQASALERLAARLGAARIFVHAYPGNSWRHPSQGRYYLLAAFERGPEAATAEPSRQAKPANSRPTGPRH